MFTDFFKTLYSGGRTPYLIPINSNLSEQQKKHIVDGTKKEYVPDKDLIFFTIKVPKTTKGIKESELKQHYKRCLSSCVEDLSSYIVAFDIYSVTPVMIKDMYGDLEHILKRWESNLKKLGDS